MLRMAGRRAALQRNLYRDRKLVLALFLALCLLLFYALRYWYLPSHAPIIGFARVVDGDTIEIGGHRIRLEGIDAPETEQTCSDGKGLPWSCGRIATRE